MLFSSPTFVVGSLSSEFLLSVLIFERTVNDLKCSYLPEANLSRPGLKKNAMHFSKPSVLLMSGLVLGKAVY